MSDLVLIVHNVRSAHNVGSILRSADGLGVRRVILSGYTPYPMTKNDSRLPHIASKVDAQIAKTALGAERSVTSEHTDNISSAIKALKADGFVVAALEQAPGSLPLPDFVPPQRLAVVVGREVEGIEPDVLSLCDQVLEIPMRGSKESYNVAVAAAIAMYHCRYPRQV
jgi:23S rRNA (guanosine2251-2'-O)-methyltransferase